MKFQKKQAGSWSDMPYYLYRDRVETFTQFPALIPASAATGGHPTFWILSGNSRQTGTPSPSPVNPNLVDPSATVPGYQESNGNIHTPTSANERTTDWIPFTTSALYAIVSGSNSGNINWVLYDSSKQPLHFQGPTFSPNTVIIISREGYSAAAFIRISWTNAANQPICVTTEQRSEYIPFDPNPPGPVIPEMCGVLNENLAIIENTDYNVNNWYFEDTRLTGMLAAGTYTISFVTDSITAGATTDGTIGIGTTSDYTDDLEWFTRAAVGSMTTVTVTLSESKCLWARFVRDRNIVKITCSISVSKIRVEEGSVAYCWKVPIICADRTTPVYLGKTQTVRRITKVVFTGQETWTEVYPGEPEAQAQGIVMYATNLSEIGTDRNDFMCSHFFVGNYRGYLISGQGRINGTYTSAVPEAFTVNYNNGSGGLQNFKAWLASEYAAGHPVTLWYALATEQTSVVNEPLCKIGDYCDTVGSENTGAPQISLLPGSDNIISFDTELPPSEFQVGFVGWHSVQDVHLRSGGQWL